MEFRFANEKDVKIIFEVKMSIVWDWEFDINTNSLTEIGDYRTHKGKPTFTARIRF